LPCGGFGKASENEEEGTKTITQKGNAMKFPPEIEFHQDIRLLSYRPKGLINEAEINRVVGVIEGIEAASQEPFNRFSATSETH